MELPPKIIILRYCSSEKTFDGSNTRYLPFILCQDGLGTNLQVFARTGLRCGKRKKRKRQKKKNEGREACRKVFLRAFKVLKGGEIMEKIKAVTTAALSALMARLGILAVPVFLMVACNIIDYATGLAAAGCRSEKIESYKGLRGIIRKICMWLLVLVGSLIDILIRYTVECAGIGISVPFLVATVVAVWIVVNEMISILENITDTGVRMPPFLMPLVRRIRRQIEETADIAESAGKEGDGEDGRK